MKAPSLHHIKSIQIAILEKPQSCQSSEIAITQAYIIISIVLNNGVENVVHYKKMQQMEGTEDNFIKRKDIVCLIVSQKNLGSVRC